MKKQDECFVRRVDNEVRDPKFINSRSNANVQKSQRFNTSNYVIEQLDIGETLYHLYKHVTGWWGEECFARGIVIFCVKTTLTVACFDGFSDDNEIKIEKLEKQYSPKRKNNDSVKAIEG